MFRGRRFREILGLICFATAISPGETLAGDGVVELSQACAVQTGCSSGDTAGFPITLTVRGSYRLTSNLQVPNQNTNGIEIGSRDITIDFNGFTLFGPNTVTVPVVVCSLSGSGIGISATGSAGGFVAMNGRVRGFGGAGIQLSSAPTVRIERMVVEENCGIGVQLGTTAIVSQVQARANWGAGIWVSFGAIVRDSIAEWNRGVGIQGDANSVLAGNVVGSNGFGGIHLSASGPRGGLVIGNAVSGNGWASTSTGISIRNGASALLNTVAGNTGAGIEAGDLVVPPFAAGLGLNTSFGNSGQEIVGGVTIGCNTTDTTKICP